MYFIEYVRKNTAQIIMGIKKCQHMCLRASQIVNLTSSQTADIIEIKNGQRYRKYIAAQKEKGRTVQHDKM